MLTNHYNKYIISCIPTSLPSTGQTTFLSSHPLLHCLPLLLSKSFTQHFNICITSYSAFSCMSSTSMLTASSFIVYRSHSVIITICILYLIPIFSHLPVSQSSQHLFLAYRPLASPAFPRNHSRSVPISFIRFPSSRPSPSAPSLITSTAGASPQVLVISTFLTWWGGARGPRITLGLSINPTGRDKRD